MFLIVKGVTTNSIGRVAPHEWYRDSTLSRKIYKDIYHKIIMIKVGELRELIRTILFSGYVAGEKPVSVMFIGKVGIGKSEILKEFNYNDNIAFFTDVTYMGLIKLLEEQKEVRHIVIPDFLKITMKKKSTTDNILSCFNAGIEEGIDKISMMGRSYDFKGKKFGLISATTKNSFIQREKTWKSMGFLSRMLIVSYDYTEKTIQEIFEYIYKREYLKENRVQLEIPIRNIEVNLTKQQAKQLKDKDTDFRKQKQFQTLVMARAILSNRTKVLQKDIDEINRFKKFFNLNYTKI